MTLPRRKGDYLSLFSGWRAGISRSRRTLSIRLMQIKAATLETSKLVAD
jgi:hypothetical protein